MIVGGPSGSSICNIGIIHSNIYTCYSEEDSTGTLYQNMYQLDRAKETPGPGKVDAVCQALLSELEKEEKKYILPIISCLVKNSKSKLDKALMRITKLKEEGDNSLAEDALKFLLLLVDVNVLFEEALGLYDFDLVLFVAEHSQKVSSTMFYYNICVIKDPLGQTHSPANSNHYFHLSFFLLREFEFNRRTNTISVKIVITNGHDCVSAWWINQVLLYPLGSERVFALFERAEKTSCALPPLQDRFTFASLRKSPISPESCPG